MLGIDPETGELTLCEEVWGHIEYLLSLHYYTLTDEMIMGLVQNLISNYSLPDKNSKLLRQLLLAYLH